MEPSSLAFNILLLPLHLKACKRVVKRTSWFVDDYFKLGKRVEPWIDQEVIKYHRTTEEYFTLLQQAGFTIINLKEATPNQTYFQSEEEYERRLRIPSSIIFLQK